MDQLRSKHSACSVRPSVCVWGEAWGCGSHGGEGLAEGPEEAKPGDLAAVPPYGHSSAPGRVVEALTSSVFHLHSPPHSLYKTLTPLSHPSPPKP